MSSSRGLAVLGTVMFVAFFAWMPIGGAAAKSPPSMPLPDPVCYATPRGTECPASDPRITAVIGGSFSAGSTVNVRTEPKVPICSANGGTASHEVWDPTPCWPSIGSPFVSSSCIYIDLRDESHPLREASCLSVLYRDSKSGADKLFTLRNKQGEDSCGGAGDFQTFYWGANGNYPDQIWMNRGPTLQDCEVTFNGRRPDGLHGPTWVEVTVNAGLGTEDFHRSADTYVSAVYYVPIDGDLDEEGVNVHLTGSFELADRGDRRVATLTAAASNLGSQDAEHVTVTFILPRQLHFDRALDPRCQQDGGAFTGGKVTCDISLKGAGDASGRDVEILDIEATIVNASDIDNDDDSLVRMQAEVADDTDPGDNEDTLRLHPSLKSGSIEATRSAMTALDAYLDYEISSPDLHSKQCNVYMDDVYAQLEAVRQAHPEVFANLSYAKVGSGYYDIPVVSAITGYRAGHVGVVVYEKGTDYHQTGIIVHGTPTLSPEDLSNESQVGTNPLGSHVFRPGGTASHGLYYRTPINEFPGSPTPEGQLGCGFEGVYPDNAGEFERSGVLSCGKVQPAQEQQACPFYPDATVIHTESPIELKIENPRGQRVETQGNQISVQELDGGIFVWPVAHEDGTYAWTLVLPPDDYSVKLVGTGAGGPYKLTMTTFDANGEAIDDVHEGTTTPGQVDDYTLKAAPAEGSDNAGTGNSGHKGGGSFGAELLLLPAALLARRRSRHR